MRLTFSKQVLLYTGVILSVMYLSGRNVNKTIYDSVVVKSEGILLPTSDPERSLEFYSSILELPSFEGRFGPAGIAFPGGQHAFFSKREQGRQTIILRARSRLATLHRSFLSRSKSTPFEGSLQSPSYEWLPEGRISTILSRPWGEEFAVADPDGNITVIFYSRKRSLSRG